MKSVTVDSPPKSRQKDLKSTTKDPINGQNKMDHLILYTSRVTSANKMRYEEKNFINLVLVKKFEMPY